MCVMSRDEEEYETEIRRQRDELDDLSAERERLLMMQQHLLKLQESLAAATDVAAQVSMTWTATHTCCYTDGVRCASYP